MRINRTGSPSAIGKTSSAGKRSKSSSSSSRSGGDSVQVSDSASLREKAKTMLAEMSEVRMDRIEEIRDALEKGTYQSDSRKIASQIVCNALAEHPWS